MRHVYYAVGWTIVNGAVLALLLCLCFALAVIIGDGIERLRLGLRLLKKYDQTQAEVEKAKQQVSKVFEDTQRLVRGMSQ